MPSATLYLVGSMLLALIVALSGAYRYFAAKSANAVKDAATIGENKGIQDSALRDNTSALRELRTSMDRYMARVDIRLNQHDARLAVSENRLDMLEQYRPAKRNGLQASPEGDI